MSAVDLLYDNSHAPAVAFENFCLIIKAASLGWRLQKPIADPFAIDRCCYALIAYRL